VKVQSLALISMSQRVAILSKPGAPILVQERPIPVIDSEHGILVKLTAAGGKSSIHTLRCSNRLRYKFFHNRLVNHHNTPQRDSGTFGTEFPSVLGNDAVGIVEKVGPKVTRFEIGDRM
jgi:NADPH:quinone reductase-like Zn-dependent oxidoreductase